MPAGKPLTTTLLQNGKLLVAGGDIGAPIAISELYDPATGTAVTNGTMTTARFQHTATLLTNGQVLVAGGVKLVLSGGRILHVALANAELYDPANGTLGSDGVDGHGALSTYRDVAGEWEGPGGGRAGDNWQ